MKNDNFWGDKTEYLQKLANEVADLKGVLQDISQQVRRIERRIDLILPSGKDEKPSKASIGRESQTPMMSGTDAHQTIEKLTDRLHEGKSIESELRDMTMKNGLIPIARVLGMTNTALPPKAKLIMNIVTRLRQSVMLTENVRKVSRIAEEKPTFKR